MSDGGEGSAIRRSVEVGTSAESPSSRGPLRSVRLGGLFWIIGAVQFLVAMILVQLAWTTPYDVLNNAISDLGAVGCRENAMGTSYVCSPLHEVFNVSIVAFGALVAVGAMADSPAFPEGRMATSGTALLIVAGVGAAIVGVFPEDTIGAAHGVGALLAFGGSAAALVLLGISMRTDPRWAHYLVLTLACGAVAGGVLLASLVRSEYGPVGFGGLERLILAPALLWLVVVGVRFARAEGSGVRARGDSNP